MCDEGDGLMGDGVLDQEPDRQAAEGPRAGEPDAPDSAGAVADPAANPGPPVAEMRPSRRQFGGVWVDDEYAWLEDPSDPAVMAHLRAENAYREAALAGTSALQETLYQELMGRIQHDDASVPVRYGAWDYYTRTETGSQYPLLARKRAEPSATEEVLLDLNQMVGDSGYLRLVCWEPSPDHRYLAYGLNESGGLESTLSLLDLETGARLPETFAPVAWRVVWANDSDAIYYVRQDDARRPFALYRHQLGTEPGRDRLLYQEDDPVFSLQLRAANDRSFLLLQSLSLESTEERFLSLRGSGDDLTLFAPRRPGVTYSLAHHGDDFLLLTNDQARNFRLLAAPESDPAAVRELIPHRDDVLIESVVPFAGAIAVFGREGGVACLELLDPGSLVPRRVAMPEPIVAVEPGPNPAYDQTAVRIVVDSFTTPTSTYDVDLTSGALALRKQESVPSGHDPAAYVTERLFAAAGDGVQVPISLTRRRDRPAGPGPTLLVGYGSYGVSFDPSFLRNQRSLLDRGVTYAVAHIRGGQEMGRAWYEDGKLLRKKNTFADFIACADHLVANGWTTPDQLIINGGSAGGLLMGAVVNARPDLARAVVAEVPFVDVIRVMLDQSLPLTSGEFVEWGDPRQPEFAAYMRSYAPYDNVRPAAYPEMLITAGLGDNQVSYWEPVKWLARLRRLTTGGQPLYLRINLGAGHSGASGRYDYLREEAHDFAFMLRAWGLVPPGGDAEPAAGNAAARTKGVA